MKDPVDHILRPGLPWRSESIVTECGYDASKVTTLTWWGFVSSSPLAPTNKSRRYGARAVRLGKILAIAGNIQWLAGCSSVPKAELAWQALHAVDVAQTVQIARSTCFHESDELTSRMIGENPSVGEALAWGVALAGAHFGVTRWLESIEAPRWLQVGWQALTIGNTAYFIKQNNDQGIKPWDTDC